MSDRSREVLVNILCGVMTDMRPATEQENHQYKVNTQTGFDLLVVGKSAGVAEAHVAKPEFSGAFDFDRVSRYEKPWFDMKGPDLLEGNALSQIYEGKSISDPFVARSVAALREHVPEYAGKLVMHGTAFPSMVLNMAVDYVDRATFTDKTLSLEKASNLRSFLSAMNVSSRNPEAAPHVMDKVAFYDLVAQVDQDMGAFEKDSIKSLAEDIDFSSVPVPR